MSMDDRYNQDRDWIDGKLVRALETAPAVTVPEDFARRVASSLPSLRPMPSAGPRVADRVAWAVLAVLLVAIVALAPSASGRGTVRWLELGFGVEFATLLAWLCLRPLLGF